MRIETKFNINDFVKTSSGIFGMIQDIRINVFELYKDRGITTNIKYRIRGNWYYQSDIELSSVKKKQEYDRNRETTTTDDMY